MGRRQPLDSNIAAPPGDAGIDGGQGDSVDGIGERAVGECRAAANLRRCRRAATRMSMNDAARCALSQERKLRVGHRRIERSGDAQVERAVCRERQRAVDAQGNGAPAVDIAGNARAPLRQTPRNLNIEGRQVLLAGLRRRDASCAKIVFARRRGCGSRDAAVPSSVPKGQVGNGDIRRREGRARIATSRSSVSPARPFTVIAARVDLRDQIGNGHAAVLKRELCGRRQRNAPSAPPRFETREVQRQRLRCAQQTRAAERKSCGIGRDGKVGALRRAPRIGA